MFSRSNLVMSRWKSALPPFVRRAIQVDQMELDSALSQMYSLCTNPSLVSKMSRARMMTKGHYYRDDPAFLVLQVVYIVLVTVAHCLTFRAGGRVWVALLANVALFFLSGLVCACVGRAVAVMYLSPPAASQGGSSHGAAAAAGSGLDAFSDYLRSDVDWRYAFDVHCNGYFTFFMWTQVFHFFMLPIVLGSPLFSNTFYLIGTITYVYNTFLGYLEIPSLTHQQRLLYPIPIVGVVYLMLLLNDVNIGGSVIEFVWD